MFQPRNVPEPRWRQRGVLVAIGLCLLVDLCASEPPAKEMSPEERQAKVKERDRLWAEAQKSRAAGNLPEAIAAAEKALAIERKLFGDTHADVVRLLQFLAELHEQREDFTAARKALKEVENVQTQRYGKDDWRVTDARLALVHIDRLATLDRKQRRELERASQLNEQVEKLGNQKKYREALPLALQAVSIRKELLGEDSPHYATSLNLLGWMYREIGDYPQAQESYDQALKFGKKLLGKNHPQFALLLNNLGWLHVYRLEYDQAEQDFRQAAEIYRKTLGERGGYITSLKNLRQLFDRLARNAEEREDFPAARKARRESLNVVAERIQKTFLEEADLPGMKRERDKQLLKPDPKDKAYVELGGICSAWTVWKVESEPKEKRTLAAAGAGLTGLACCAMSQGPLLTVSVLVPARLKRTRYEQVFDIRYVFPSSTAAKAYIERRLPSLSENMEPITNFPNIGEETHVFVRTKQFRERGPTFRAYNYLFRQGHVVVKLFRFEELGDEVVNPFRLADEGGGGSTPLKMGALSHKIANRLRALQRERRAP